MCFRNHPYISRCANCNRNCKYKYNKDENPLTCRWHKITELQMGCVVVCPVSWSCRIHRLYLCRGIRLPNKCPRYDSKQSNGEVPVMLELWWMQTNLSLPSLPCPLWSGVAVPNRVLSMGQIGLNCELMLNWITWNRTVSIFKLCTYAKLNYLK